MQNREKRAARTPQPQKKCPHDDARVNAWTAGAAASARTDDRAQCKDCGGASICEHSRQRSTCF
jgi:hypothetical protein